jgi:hypothetical protein
MKTFIAITATAGLALAALGTGNLKRSEAGISYHHNPLAIHESAYGKLLAQLSQDTVDRVWHMGVEQANPETHNHGGDSHEGHDHGADEDCESCNKADEAEQLLDRVTSSSAPKIEVVATAEHSEHAGHDHAHGEDCESCKKADSAVKLLDSVVSKSEENDPHAGHDHDSHAEHDHDSHAGHDHDNKSNGFIDAIAVAKDFIDDMKAAGYERTSPYAVTEAHKKHVAGEIEQMLLRSYKMDPTNYGVYNAYYLFLTIHEFRSTPVALDQARKISHITIARARDEDTAPGPWLTAEMALLNLFFLDQGEWNKQGIAAPIDKLREYRDFSAYLQQQFEVLKQRAIAEGRWETISVAQREEMNERQRFAGKTFEQFDIMIARHDKPKSEFPNLIPKLPVASSDSQEEDDEVGNGETP